MIRLLKWFYILNKRLYKKAAFIVILALILVSVIIFSVAANTSSSGFVRVALAQSNPNDKISLEIINILTSEDSMVRYTLAKNPVEAIDLVKTGQADSAWIFPEDMGDSDAEFSVSTDNPVRVIEREQNVFSRLVREKLSAVLFRFTSRAYFVTYTKENLPELALLSNEQLLSYFENAKINEELFVFDNPVSMNNTGGSAYLTAPLRGLLGVITLLGGMAGVLYFMKDEEKRVFAGLTEQRRDIVSMLSVFAATINLSLVSMVALLVSGLYRFSLTELVGTLLFAFCSASFLMVLKEVLSSPRSFGAFIPALIIVISCICPVFFNFKMLRGFSFLFPPTYYINMVGSSIYLLHMCGYSTACLLIAYIIRRIKKHRNAISRCDAKLFS